MKLRPHLLLTFLILLTTCTSKKEQIQLHIYNADVRIVPSPNETFELMEGMVWGKTMEPVASDPAEEQLIQQSRSYYKERSLSLVEGYRRRLEKGIIVEETLAKFLRRVEYQGTILILFEGRCNILSDDYYIHAPIGTLQLGISTDGGASWNIEDVTEETPQRLDKTLPEKIRRFLVS